MKKITFIFKKIRPIFFLILLFTIYTYFSARTYASDISSNISDEVFRLHVIANSNSEDDQNLKYIVRDALLLYMNEISVNVTSKTELVKIISSNEMEFLKIAQQTIIDNGYNYSVEISIGNFEFPIKTYGDISLPAGSYDALKVEIGEAIGENWWCVMFPPLCFIDVSTGIVPDESKEVLEDNLSSEEFTLISDDDNQDISFKFKILEFFNIAN